MTNTFCDFPAINLYGAFTVADSGYNVFSASVKFTADKRKYHLIGGFGPKINAEGGPGKP